MSKIIGVSNSIGTPLGLSAFDELRAEDEPWLLQVFEPPPEFDLIIGSRSAVISGDVGSGKTAVYQALIRSSLSPKGSPQRLLVTWRLTPPRFDLQADTNPVSSQLAQVLATCGMSILTHLCHNPTAFSNAPEWAQKILVWFIQQHLSDDFELRAKALVATLDDAGRSLFTKLTTCPVENVIHPGAPPEMVITEFVKALQKMQLKGVWVLVDGLEAWNDTDQEQLAAGLTTFLSALNLFERGGFAYKMLMPAKLDRSLSRASGIQRRRIDLHRLRWPTHKLIALVEKRLALASKGKVRSLADLCEDKELITWLERCGGNTPRGWLEQIRPLVAAYFERVEAGQSGPISQQEWVEIRQRHPPLLILDKEQRQVTIGRREVNDLSAGLFELLEYLYDRSGQICSKSEIYYCLQREMDHEPVSLADPDWEIPKTYEGQIDTMIWRLREALEPNPRSPVFIITVKGRGVRLDNAW